MVHITATNKHQHKSLLFSQYYDIITLHSQTKDINETLPLLSEDPRRDGTEAIRRETTESMPSQPEPRSAGLPGRRKNSAFSVFVLK